MPLGQVTRDLREADQRSSNVAQGGDHHVGPEQGAVFAYPPAFVLDASVATCQLEQPLGPTSGSSLGRVETSVVLTDDLVGGVALHALGTSVPARDVPVRREQEDRVVSDPVDEQPE